MNRFLAITELVCEVVELVAENDMGSCLLVNKLWSEAILNRKWRVLTNLWDLFRILYLDKGIETTEVGRSPS